MLDKVCLNGLVKENEIININEKVDLSKMNLTEIPLQFGKVNKSFDCRSNNLTTLKYAPFIVGMYFSCRNNQLTSLEGGPKEVGTSYSCARNQLTTLIDAPKICNNFFNCSYNQLTSLEGCPSVIKGTLYCNYNPNLEYLWGIGHVESYVFYDNRNEINEWIIACMRRDIIFPYYTLEENINWIKHEQKYSSLLEAPNEIRKYFSPRVLNNSDSGLYNF